MMVQDEWPRAYVALTGGSVPGLRVVARSDDPGAIALFGPFRRVAQLREAVRALAEGTGLRDCEHDDVDVRVYEWHAQHVNNSHGDSNIDGKFVADEHADAKYDGQFIVHAFADGKHYSDTDGIADVWREPLEYR
jgi:hypothetical protein